MHVNERFHYLLIYQRLITKTSITSHHYQLIYCEAQHVDLCIVHSLSQTKCYCVFPILPSADNSNVRTVKTEGPSLVKPCIFDSQLKSISSERSDCSGQSSKRQEDTPMEVSSNPPPTDVFKVIYHSFSRKRHQNIYFRIADGNILVPLFS